MRVQRFSVDLLAGRKGTAGSVPNPDSSYPMRTSVPVRISQNWNLRIFAKKAQQEESLRILANKRILWMSEKEKKRTHLEKGIREKGQFLQYTQAMTAMPKNWAKEKNVFIKIFANIFITISSRKHEIWLTVQVSSDF